MDAFINFLGSTQKDVNAYILFCHGSSVGWLVCHFDPD